MINIVQAAGIGLNTLSLFSKHKAGQVAVDLFCRPHQGRIFTLEDHAFLQTAIWESYTFQNQKIQSYTWEGAGKTVLLAHGYNSHTARWRFLIPLLLKAGFRVVALDAPSHGHSGWKRVNALLYAQVIDFIMPHLKPNFVIGHSFGGMASVYYFAEMKALPVEALILMSVPAELTDIEKVFFTTLGLNQRTHEGFIQAFEEQFKFKREYFSVADYMKKVSFPGLVIHDKWDDIAPFSGGQRIHKHWKEGACLWTEGLGHSLQGQVVYQGILDYLKK